MTQHTSPRNLIFRTFSHERILVNIIRTLSFKNKPNHRLGVDPTHAKKLKLIPSSRWVKEIPFKLQPHVKLPTNLLCVLRISWPQTGSSGTVASLASVSHTVKLVLVIEHTLPLWRTYAE